MNQLPLGNFKFDAGSKITSINPVMLFVKVVTFFEKQLEMIVDEAEHFI